MPSKELLSIKAVEMSVAETAADVEEKVVADQAVTVVAMKVEEDAAVIAVEKETRIISKVYKDR